MGERSRLILFQNKCNPPGHGEQGFRAHALQGIDKTHNSCCLWRLRRGIRLVVHHIRQTNLLRRGFPVAVGR